MGDARKPELANRYNLLAVLLDLGSGIGGVVVLAVTISNTCKEALPALLSQILPAGSRRRPAGDARASAAILRWRERIAHFIAWERHICAILVAHFAARERHIRVLSALLLYARQSAAEIPRRSLLACVLRAACSVCSEPSRSFPLVYLRH